MLENLRKLRLEAGVTQKQLADAVSVSQQSINKYENHNIEPDIETLTRLADFFHTSLDCLTGHAAPPEGALSAEEARLLNEYRRLSDSQRRCVCNIVHVFLEQRP